MSQGRRQRSTWLFSCHRAPYTNLLSRSPYLREGPPLARPNAATNQTVRMRSTRPAALKPEMTPDPAGWGIRFGARPLTPRPRSKTELSRLQWLRYQGDVKAA